MPLSLPFLDYEVPDELKKRIKIGQLVKIPFLKSEDFGVVMDTKSALAKNNIKIKFIKELVFDEPILSKEQLCFLREVADFYHTSLGFLLKTNLLPLQKNKIKNLSLKKINFYDAGKKPTKPTVFTFKNIGAKAKFILDKISDCDSQILYLVPELTFIEKIQNLLSPKLLFQSTIITSELSSKELFRRWVQIWSGEKQIVIGTRRALFLPWFNLKKILLDDEANANYKSWDMAPRIHTRDAALFLSKHHSAELYLLSHTPSVETYYFAEQKIYSNSSPDIIPPIKNNPVEVIDLKTERRLGNYNFLSNYLLAEFKKTSNADIFFFINRRGTANYVGCRDCGNVKKCPNCRFSLNYHQNENILKCHYCQYSEPMQTTCSVCHGVNMAMYGTGTQLAENTIRKILGNSDKRPVIRIDSDEKNSERLKTEDNKIIIGTQLAWPYVDWSRIKLLAFLDADASLFIPEYKITENLWQLLRSALYNLPDGAKFIIQTNHPEHIVFKSIKDPLLFYQEQLKERQMLGYPPFKFLLKMFFGHHKKEEAEKEVIKTHRYLLNLTAANQSIKIVGPLEATPYCHEGQYWQIILAKLKYETYKQSVKLLLSNLPGNWKADPNPNSILYFS